MVAELGKLTTDWLQDPKNNEVLRDIRRHFHTFKGNGRAVGANILGELGWAAQDMLDRSLDGDLAPGRRCADSGERSGQRAARPGPVLQQCNRTGCRTYSSTDQCVLCAGSIG